ncbi:MAG: 4Fe-4S binding protein [Oscillospiraceae bacterium]
MGMLVLSMVNSKCTECIQCGECVDECPKKVLKYKILWRKNK